MKRIFSYWNVSTLIIVLIIASSGFLIVNLINPNTLGTVVSGISGAAGVLFGFLQWRHSPQTVPKIMRGEIFFLCAMVFLAGFGTIGYVAFNLNKGHTANSPSGPTTTPSLISPSQSVPSPTSIAQHTPLPTSTVQPLPQSASTPPSLASSCDITKAPALPAVSSSPTNAQQEQLFSAYKERLTYLVNNCQLRTLQPNDQTLIQAENDTATTITHLDGARNDSLFQFLRQSQLVGKQSVISLAGQDLSGAQLNVCHNGCQGSDGIDLSYLDFTGANLSGANLNRAKLVGAHLENTNLTNGTNIGNVDFTDANLQGATTDNADVIGQAHATVCRTTMPNGKVVSQCPAS